MQYVTKPCVRDWKGAQRSFSLHVQRKRRYPCKARPCRFGLRVITHIYRAVPNGALCHMTHATENDTARERPYYYHTHPAALYTTEPTAYAGMHCAAAAVCDILVAMQRAMMLCLMAATALIGCAPPLVIVMDEASAFARQLAAEFGDEYGGEMSVLVAEGDALDDVAELAGAGDVLWVTDAYSRALVGAGVLQPVDNVVNLDNYMPSIVHAGHTWGVPISGGDHLVLFYNRSLLSTVPQDTDELVATARRLTDDAHYGIVWDQTEPLWVVPWVGGFGGALFASDGVTPTLDTPAMVASLQFLVDLHNVHRAAAAYADYAGADTLFRSGRAAMSINGAWALDVYREELGDALGVAPLPRVVATQAFPVPYAGGTYFMIPRAVRGRVLRRVHMFIEYATNYQNQMRIFDVVGDMPMLREALDDPRIRTDPLLGGVSVALAHSMPMPVGGMEHCSWNAIRAELSAVFTAAVQVQDAVRAMAEQAALCGTGY